MYKTLADLERVINLGKPQKVIDKFVDSYLTGVAIQPYLDVEKEYSELIATEDKDSQEEITKLIQVLVTPAVYSEPEGNSEIELISEAVYEDQEEIVQESINYNQIRDDRISELEIEYPHLIEPEQTYTAVESEVYNEETGEQDIVINEIPDNIPSVIERRPEIVLNYNLVQNIVRTYNKKLRDENIKGSTVTTSFGNVFDADEISQSRMARALLVSQSTGQTATQWVLADNSVAVIDNVEMGEALGLAMQNQANEWFV